MSTPGWAFVSVLAAPMRSITCSPLRIGQPSISTSSPSTRGTAGTGLSQRSSSSMAEGMTDSSVATCRRCSGFCERWPKMQSRVSVTVSSPAMMKRKQMSRISSSVRVTPSTSDRMIRASRSSVGARRRSTRVFSK